jgi:hypothetical protein
MIFHLQFQRSGYLSWLDQDEDPTQARACVQPQSHVASAGTLGLALPHEVAHAHTF